MPENRSGLTLLKTEDWLAVWIGLFIVGLSFLMLTGIDVTG